ncbi:MAG: response regulator transcription factor [Clostridia bacterium]|nr:response regulator transcription factor [Clostridia bacterium]MBQ7038573.1 response regulator transcription factor [Clostridia bacterium]
MSRVLVCEDERPIRELLAINLKRYGYEVFEATSGEEALRVYDETPRIELVLLDIMLPQMDGFAVCEALRERDASLGIVMLTARAQESEKIKALKLGADDYVTKPFSPSELAARLEALERRIARSKSSVLQSGEFVLDLRTRTLKKADRTIELTQVEFQLMQCFLENQGRPLSRTDILYRVWGSEYFGEEKIVDVNIRRLRMKVEDSASNPRHIITVWGTGYCWNEE